MANLKWLWIHMNQVKGLLLLSTVLMAMEAFSNLASIGLQQAMIDEVMVNGQAHRFWPILLQIAMAYLAYSLLFTFGPHAIHMTIAKVRSSMSRELMLNMYQLPISELQKERSANYVYHFSNDLQTSAHLAANDLPRIVQQLVTVIVIIVVIAMASPMLLGVMLIMVTFYTVMGKNFGSARKQVSAEINRHKSDLLVHLEEGVSSTREVIAFHRQDWETQLYRNKFGSYFDSVMKEGKLINKQLLLSDPLKWGILIFVLSYCGILVLEDHLSIGLFVVTYQYATRFMDSLGGIYQFIMSLTGKMASVDRVCGVLQGEKLKDGPSTLSGTVCSIQFQNVSFQYGTQPILKHLTLSIPAGRKTAFVGASGGGKSTIASLLVRFFEPTEGQIHINNLWLENIRRADWMSRVTLVFQEPYLFPDTIRTNLLLGLEGVSEERMIEVCQAMQIDYFIKGLPEGYDTVIGERGVTLSGGQRQRLALARAVLRDTEILILDEATSSLDLETERKVQENLDWLRQGRTTVIIAHRLSTIQNSDLIIVMDQGTVAEQGTHDELMTNDFVYRGLVLKQNDKQ